MLVLLPPSETKRAGGDGPPLRLEEITHHDELGATRAALVDDVVALADDVPASRAALDISERQDDEIERNAALRVAPTMPALDRYTGVLYDALDARSFTRATRARARSRLAVGSALFGLVQADDPIPAYRLSADSKIPARDRTGVGRGRRPRGGDSAAPTSLTSLWRPVLDPLLFRIASGELVVDLRSGAYAALGRIPQAVTVNVLAERPDGTRSVVSHHNKTHKGALARLLATSRAEPSDASSIARIARRAGHTVERDGDHLDLVLPA
ncbi:peroxide stress protein YaaA [Pseudonocardia endophytica]|uniref:peroxide stress protein YaaA n=1 Tax=Pseudonocardia endophytica TaxID=401976 RepID=UPI0010517458|nr:peroxide stress protein YaaA [Pseudonocardia endophytica]